MKNATTKKLSAMPYAQASVTIDSEGNIALYSYTTLVCFLNAEGWLRVTGLYSATTRKHIGAFMREYVEYPNGNKGCYYDAKVLYNKHIIMNIHTGEIEEL